MIGDRVRKHRKWKGMSQEQLGAMVGFSQAKISKIENGNCDSLSDYRSVARALEVPIEELISDRWDEDDSPVDGHRGGTVRDEPDD